MEDTGVSFCHGWVSEHRAMELKSTRTHSLMPNGFHQLLIHTFPHLISHRITDCMSLHNLKNRHQEGNKCVRILAGEISVRENGEELGKGHTAVHLRPWGTGGCVGAAQTQVQSEDNSTRPLRSLRENLTTRATLCVPGAGLPLLPSVLGQRLGGAGGSMAWSECAGRLRSMLPGPGQFTPLWAWVLGGVFPP